MASKYTFVLLFLEILFNYLFILSSADLSASLESLEQVPPSPVIKERNPRSDPDYDFNFTSAIIEAKEFYKKLPKRILMEASMLVPELVKSHGYPCETHKVMSDDGYILTMHRIPYGQNKTENRPVVYLQHGLLSSSADWVVPGPEKGFGFLLADAGYDVWMPNVRGNRYSRDHINLDIDDKRFWNFGWHEIAWFDVTAMIDYALNKTRQEKLFYIGHSQGTTIFYVMCSEKPEYNQKIHAQFSLAPLAYMSHIWSPLLSSIAEDSFGYEVFSSMFDLKEFLPNARFLERVGNFLCKYRFATEVLCTNALFAFCGFNQNQMNATLLPSIMEHSPAGASVKQILHYTQLVNSNEFRRWDYGDQNGRYYGTTEPPSYKLSKVTAPVYLYFSKEDWLAREENVLRLANELGNVQGKTLILDGDFNHVDYLYGIDARRLVYDNIITLMKEL